MKRILVVDDNADILEVITMILDTEGYQVETIKSGYELSDKVASFHPDLILLDVMLGDHDGRDLCMLLKSSPLTEHIPVIIISASHDLLSVSGKFCHPDDYIAKPFDIDNLLDKVSNQLA